VTSLVKKGLPWLAAVALGAFAFLPICDLHFDCGCGFPGFGGHSHCDILTAGSPDCPWCDHTWLGYAAMAFSAALGLAAVLVLPRRAPWTLALIAALAGVFGAQMIAGVATSLWLGRPLLAGM
jgi:hypothetical protein